MNGNTNEAEGAHARRPPVNNLLFCFAGSGGAAALSPRDGGRERRRKGGAPLGQGLPALASRFITQRRSNLIAFTLYVSAKEKKRERESGTAELSARKHGAQRVSRHPLQ